MGTECQGTGVPEEQYPIKGLEQSPKKPDTYTIRTQPPPSTPKNSELLKIPRSTVDYGRVDTCPRLPMPCTAL